MLGQDACSILLSQEDLCRVALFGSHSSFQAWLAVNKSTHDMLIVDEQISKGQRRKWVLEEKDDFVREVRGKAKAIVKKNREIIGLKRNLRENSNLIPSKRKLMQWEILHKTHHYRLQIMNGFLLQKSWSQKYLGSEIVADQRVMADMETWKCKAMQRDFARIQYGDFTDDMIKDCVTDSDTCSDSSSDDL